MYCNIRYPLAICINWIDQFDEEPLINFIVQLSVCVCESSLSKNDYHRLGGTFYHFGMVHPNKAFGLLQKNRCQTDQSLAITWRSMASCVTKIKSV